MCKLPKLHATSRSRVLNPAAPPCAQAASATREGGTRPSGAPTCAWRGPTARWRTYRKACSGWQPLCETANRQTAAWLPVGVEGVSYCAIGGICRTAGTSVWCAETDHESAGGAAVLSKYRLIDTAAQRLPSSTIMRIAGRYGDYTSASCRFQMTSVLVSVPDCGEVKCIYMRRAFQRKVSSFKALPRRIHAATHIIDSGRQR